MYFIGLLNYFTGGVAMATEGRDGSAQGDLIGKGPVWLEDIIVSHSEVTSTGPCCVRGASRYRPAEWSAVAAGEADSPGLTEAERA
jgi:hypothetical protein